MSYNGWWDAENVSLWEVEYGLAKSAWDSAFCAGFEKGQEESKDDIKFWNDAFLEQRESSDNYVKEMRLEFGAMVYERDEQIAKLKAGRDELLNALIVARNDLDAVGCHSGRNRVIDALAKLSPGDIEGDKS